MSVPARIWQKRSAVADVRGNRGSREISFAFRLRLASIAHLKPQGWFSAGLPPMINIMSVFLMSIQPLVMAPRPNVGPKLETLGAWQTRAWFSKYTKPRLLIVLTTR